MRPWRLAACCCLVLAVLLPPGKNPGTPGAPAVQPVSSAMREDAQQPDLRKQLRVVTLNAWGLWLVSRRRAERMAALADWLRSPACPADVVLLQEVWVEADVALLCQAGAEGRLPHSFHWQSGAIGSGLLLLSALPIAEAAFHPYSARGDPAAVLQGDFYAGKGVGWAALQAPAGRLSVFNTHLSANYGQEWQAGAHALAPDCRLPRDSLAGVRLLQVLELAAFVRARGAGSGGGVVLAGDLNSAPGTLEQAALRALLPELRDAWAATNPLLLGATANALESSFTTAGAGKAPIRIDYILTTLAPLAASLTLTDTELGFGFSDHLGVAATLGIGPAADGSGGSDCDGVAVGAAASSKGGRQRAAQACTPPRAGEQQQQDGEQDGAQLCQLSAAPSAAELMQRQPEPFLEAAATLEAAAEAMQHGRRRFLSLSVALWAAGFGCLGALVAARPHHAPAAAAQPSILQQLLGGRPAAQPAAAQYLALLGGMGLAMGWAGALLIGGVVVRGVEHRALRQAALQLRLAVGTAPARAAPITPRSPIT